MTKTDAMEGPMEQPKQVPRWAMPFVGVGGALVGGLYVIFMPFILGGMVLYYAGVKVARLVKGTSGELAAAKAPIDRGRPR
jgi:uncharacterized membrane protein HdeD (DUF308 family)